MMIPLTGTEIEIPRGATPIGIRVWFRSDPIRGNGQVCRDPNGHPIMDASVLAAEAYIRMPGFSSGWSWATGNIHYRPLKGKEERGLVARLALKKWTNGKQIWHEPKNAHLPWATEVSR